MLRHFAILLLTMSITSTAFSGISDLSASYRNGQVFITWNESELPDGATLKVLELSANSDGHSKVPAETQLVENLKPGSARDWWRDTDSFYCTNERPSQPEQQGFVIENSADPLPLSSGLFVHTVTREGNYSYTVELILGNEIQQSISLEQPIHATPAPVLPITLKGNILERGSRTGKPLILRMHGRGDGLGVDKDGTIRGTHLVFSPTSWAWREGIAFKFDLLDDEDAVRIMPMDRIWTGRKLTSAESRDNRDRLVAINTFWLGYNVNIAETTANAPFIADNYTERYLLYLIRWAQTYLGCDPDRTYIEGCSMGGTAAIQMCMHYPDIFAAANAEVPMFSFNWDANSENAWRLTCSFGPFTQDIPATLPDGRDWLDYVNATTAISNSAIDYPPIFACNGRTDGSIPWVNNPPFYHAANKARQAFSVFWNNGQHSMPSSVPADMNGKAKLLSFNRKQSYPAFSNCSANLNPGYGNPKEGDIIGWINRGLAWTGDIIDTPFEYSINLVADAPEMPYPVTADVTLRRRQAFKPVAGEYLHIEVNGNYSTQIMPSDGLLTITGISFNNASPVTLKIRRE